MNGLLLNLLPYIDAILGIGLMIGGIFAMRNGRRNALATIQEQTINAQESRISTLQSRIVDLEKTSAKQEYVIETMELAMKQEGFTVTISGDLITIQDANGRAIRRKRAVPKKQEVP